MFEKMISDTKLIFDVWLDFHNCNYWIKSFHMCVVHNMPRLKWAKIEATSWVSQFKCFDIHTLTCSLCSKDIESVLSNRLI